tara:strand:- start:1 stop:162 length:162 start_codon:yes stop_codon:yes gene_type:complete
LNQANQELRAIGHLAPTLLGPNPLKPSSYSLTKYLARQQQRASLNINIYCDRT